MRRIVYIQAHGSDKGYRIDYNGLLDLEFNYQLNSSYEITFTLTYTHRYEDAFKAAQDKASVFFDGEIYTIQQADLEINKDGLLQYKITANHSLIDKMKNCRVDKTYPTEDNPEMSGGTQGTTDNQPKEPGVVTKKTSEQQTYTINDRLDKFFNNNDQKISYGLHGDFPSIAVDVQDTSLYEWLNQHLKEFSAYYVPTGNKLEIYDLKNLQHQTGRQFRYQSNMTNVDMQTDVTDLVNSCEVYGGKMEKDITSGGGSGAGGSLDNAEAFAKSPINADFGVNKQQMLNDFASRDVRVRAWGVDVNRLYDTVKNAGVSPEWFFAYDLQEGNPTYFSWLNHYGSHLADPYADATRVCNWIKSFANSDSFQPATGYGAYASAQLTAQWDQEFGKGTIGRLYLQGTAAAVMEMANENPGRYGRPISGCANQIKAWGGHNTQGASSSGAQKWIQTAKSFVGIPYVWGGGHSPNANPKNGMDCSGLGEQIARACGLNIGYGATTNLEAGSQPINRDQVQTGDMGFYGAPGNSYHVVWALDNNTYIAEPDVGKTCYIGQINSYPASFWKRNPQIAAFVGNGTTSGSDGSSDLNTTTETYYALHFHYQDDESIKKYGLHRGKPLAVDSIYDMDALKKYADINIQHNPKTTLTVKDFYESDFHIGDVWQVIVPEMRLKVGVTLLGIKYKPFNPDNTNATLSFNNSGLVMQSIINTLYEGIQGINTRPDQFNTMTNTSSRQENRLDNVVIYSQDQMKKVREFVGVGGES